MTLKVRPDILIQGVLSEQLPEGLTIETYRVLESPRNFTIQIVMAKPKKETSK